MKKIVKVPKEIKDASKKPIKDFSERAKRPIFISGVAFWIGLLLFFALSSTATGRVINSQEILGVSGPYLFILLFIVLGVLLFVVWKKMIKKK